MQPESANHGHPGIAGLLERGVQIRHHLITQLKILLTNWLDGRVIQILGIGMVSWCLLVTDLTFGPPPRQVQTPIAAVRTEQRIECRELKPTSEEFAGVFLRGDESTDISAPIGNATQARIDANRDMRLQG